MGNPKTPADGKQLEEKQQKLRGARKQEEVDKSNGYEKAKGEKEERSLQWE